MPNSFFEDRTAKCAEFLIRDRVHVIQWETVPHVTWLAAYHACFRLFGMHIGVFVYLSSLRAEGVL